MNRLKLKFYGHPVLRKKCQEVKEINQEVKDFAQEMLRVMEKEGGVGLAAPQVGDLRRIIVVDIGQGPLSLVNPKIVKKSEKRKKGEEGCLSLPGISLRVRRPNQVTIQGYLLEKDQNVEIKADGLLARDFQHEIDHLNGKLIIDHVSLFKKRRAIKKIKKNLRE